MVSSVNILNTVTQLQVYYRYLFKYSWNENEIDVLCSYTKPIFVIFDARITKVSSSGLPGLKVIHRITTLLSTMTNW